MYGGVIWCRSDDPAASSFESEKRKWTCILSVQNTYCPITAPLNDMMLCNSNPIHEAAYIVSTFTVSRLPGKMWHHTVRQEILKVGPKLASGYFQFGSDCLAEREWQGNSLLIVVSMATQHTVWMNCLSGAIISNLGILIMHRTERCFVKKPHKKLLFPLLWSFERVLKRERLHVTWIYSSYKENQGKFAE